MGGGLERSRDPTVTVPPAIACAFKGCAGFFHPAGASTGVVLCAPWGFEDLIMRTSWRHLAEAIAAAGYPCLRFDYPGTGDSLGTSLSVTSVSTWIKSIHDATEELRLRSGVRGFVYLGQSLGALLAMAAASTRRDVVALQLVAPVAKGRTYVREMAATAAMVADRLGLQREPSRPVAPDSGLDVVGFDLSAAMVADLKTLDAAAIVDLRTPRIAVFDSPERKAGAEVSEHLRRCGLAVETHAIAPYHLLVSDATTLQPLPVSPDEVVAALHDMAPASPWPAATPPRVAPALVTDLFREEPQRFGPDGRLFGVLTVPAGARSRKPVVLMLNRGLNPHIGWRRVAVEHARALASEGVASLRIDLAGLGESGEEPGRPENLIYSDLLLDDVTAAVDLLSRQGFTEIAVTGVCSGAYLALQAARTDPRVTHAIAFNPQRFVWNDAESTEDVIRYGLRSMTDYVGDVRSGGALRKLVRSRARIVPALRFLLKSKLRKGLSRVPLALRSTLLRNSMAALVTTMFETLARRGTAVSLVFTEGDPGVDELRTYFGPGGRALRYDNVAVTCLGKIDHNFTSRDACETVLHCTMAGLRPRAAQDKWEDVAPVSPSSRQEACVTA